MTLGGHDYGEGEARVHTDTGASDASDGFRIRYVLKRCPNPECHASDLRVIVRRSEALKQPSGHVHYAADKGPAGIGAFQFLPSTPAPLSKHVPRAVLTDYQEAYLIRELSPKASATLARRALQGMVRDFWGVSKSKLHDELLAIKDRCDPDVYDAMMAVKSVGNIGAHPERDVSLIVEVVSGEAQQLLDVIHLLDQEWYLARAERAARIDRMKELGAEKQELKRLGLGDATPPAASASNKLLGK